MVEFTVGAGVGAAVVGLAVVIGGGVGAAVVGLVVVGASVGSATGSEVRVKKT